MNLANTRALFSLTVEELLLAENISDAQWNAIYRPKADCRADSGTAGFCCEIQHAGERARSLAEAGQEAPDYSSGEVEA